MPRIISLILVIIQSARAETAIPCVVPPEATEDLKFAFAFEREFRPARLRLPAIVPGETWIAEVQYSWWKMGLFFFLASSGEVFSYNPDSVVRPLGSEISSIDCGPAKDLISCLERNFPSGENTPQQANGPIAKLKDATFPGTGSSPRICQLSLGVPPWQPSPDSPLKRFIIDKLRERIPIEIPGNVKKLLISDFNLNDPTILVYAESDLPGQGSQRLWLPAALNWRRIPQPVYLTRLGPSLVEDENQVKALLKHSIRLVP